MAMGLIHLTLAKLRGSSPENFVNRAQDRTYRSLLLAVI